MSDILQKREYAIVPSDESDKVDFSQIIQDPINLHYSIDRNKFIIKWNTGSVPSFLSGIINLEGPYTYDEILDILNNSPEWNPALNITIDYTIPEEA